MAHLKKSAKIRSPKEKENGKREKKKANKWENVNSLNNFKI